MLFRKLHHHLVIIKCNRTTVPSIMDERGQEWQFNNSSSDSIAKSILKRTNYSEHTESAKRFIANSIATGAHTTSVTSVSVSFKQWSDHNAVNDTHIEDHVIESNCHIDRKGWIWFI